MSRLVRSSQRRTYMGLSWESEKDGRVPTECGFLGWPVPWMCNHLDDGGAAAGDTVL